MTNPKSNATERAQIHGLSAATRYNYTVIGNEVNLASRLERLTKETVFHARIICSDVTRSALKGTHALRNLGETEIRGKAGTLRIWAVDPPGV